MEKEYSLEISDYGLSAQQEQDIQKWVPDFSNADIAIRNTLKLMDGQNGGAFYVCYVMDEIKMYGWLRLTIVYPDNSYKAVILYKNSFRETDTENDGVYKAPPTPKGCYTSLDKDILDDYVSFPQYETPTMPIPARTLWRKIQENYSSIPIVKIQQAGSLGQIYFELAQRATEYAQKSGQEFMDAESEFYVPAGDFRAIIEDNGWTVNEARTTFDSVGLLKKDKATNSYQKSKHIKGRYVRFYVFKKSVPLSGNDPVPLEDTTYVGGGFQTKEEKTIKHLETAQKVLLNKYNKLAEQVGVDYEI